MKTSRQATRGVSQPEEGLGGVSHRRKRAWHALWSGGDRPRCLGREPGRLSQGERWPPQSPPPPSWTSPPPLPPATSTTREAHHRRPLATTSSPLVPPPPSSPTPWCQIHRCRHRLSSSCTSTRLEMGQPDPFERPTCPRSHTMARSAVVCAESTFAMWIVQNTISCSRWPDCSHPQNAGNAVR